MTRTSAATVLLTALVAGAIAWLLEGMLVMSGRVAVVPPVTLGVALMLLGAVLLVLAWPVRQAAQGKRRIDYRHATAALGFAKASSLVGAMLGGAALGALGFFLTRSVVATDAVVAVAVVAVGGLVQLIAGLLAEHWCVLPPDDDDGAAVAGSPA
ncbi:DUF3180 family protein [Agrococcus sp. ProA11]|uniref:DUF3180 family protein n=1 Tax=Agrococcus chionoecetis TaxID=3153752 RepID=UPI00326196FB